MSDQTEKEGIASNVSESAHENTRKNCVILGDSTEVLKTLPDDSVDLVCTDPPYGYSFMNAGWDKVVPSVEIWRECLRVLKPGAFAFVMSAPRQDVLSQMIVRLGEAGFDTGFTSIYWTYASGFPKAMNIGKAVDKRMDAEREVVSVESRSQSRPNSGGVQKGAGIVKGGYNMGGDFNISLPATSEAKALDGSYAGFQPKPAVEIIIVAMKPLSEKTYVDQALKNGKGVTWLDDCRVPTKLLHGEARLSAPGGGSGGMFMPNGSGVEGPRHSPAGRFPANILVSDDILNDGRESKSKSGKPRSGKNGEGWGMTKTGAEHDDSGSYSRFFSLDAWASNLPEHVRKVFDELNSKAYNTEVCEPSSHVAIAESNSPTTEPTGQGGVGSVHAHASHSSGSGSQNLSAPSVGKDATFTGTDTALNPAPTNPDTETSDETSNTSASESTTPTTPSKLTPNDQTDANSVAAALSDLSDIIQTWRNQLKSSGSVKSAITVPTQLETSLVQQWPNFAHLPESVRRIFPFLAVAKASKREKNEGLDGFEEKVGNATYGEFAGTPEHSTNTTNATKNTHATVKPLTLMSYLITLGSRPNDVVLDPFLGSGTTACAAKALGRKYVGIEREEEYVRIAEARVNAVDGEKVEVTEFVPEARAEPKPEEKEAVETDQQRRSRLIDDELNGRKLTPEELKFLKA